MKRPAEPLTSDEALRLLDECRNTRDKALVALLWRSGLRCSEALALKPHHVDMQTGSITVLHGKGDKARIVGCDCQALAMLAPWLAVRPDSEWLFCTRSGAQIIPAYVRRLMKRLGRRAKIAKRVHPHGLRHSLASDMAKERHPINVIQAQLGHSDAATTARYIARIAPEMLLETMRKRTWATR